MGRLNSPERVRKKDEKKSKQPDNVASTSRESILKKDDKKSKLWGLALKETQVTSKSRDSSTESVKNNAEKRAKLLGTSKIRENSQDSPRRNDDQKTTMLSPKRQLSFEEALMGTSKSPKGNKSPKVSSFALAVQARLMENRAKLDSPEKSPSKSIESPNRKESTSKDHESFRKKDDKKIKS